MKNGLCKQTVFWWSASITLDNKPYVTPNDSPPIMENTKIGEKIGEKIWHVILGNRSKVNDLGVTQPDFYIV